MQACKIIFCVFFVSAVVFSAAFAREVNKIEQGRTFYVNLLVKHKPQIFFEEEALFVSRVDFNAMRENFPNIVAWIKSEDMNYPVVQATDNNFYLSRLPNGDEHVMGSIFLDYRNTHDFSDKNIFIYGHNMRSGDMFGSLKNCEKKDISIFTPSQDYALELIEGYVIDVTDAKKRSLFGSDSEINSDDRLVHLVTCTQSKSKRLVIVGRLGCRDEAPAP
jgi:SrtB family sortase